MESATPTGMAILIGGQAIRGFSQTMDTCNFGDREFEILNGLPFVGHTDFGGLRYPGLETNIDDGVLRQPAMCWREPL